jgi:hypothetical protein
LRFVLGGLQFFPDSIHEAYLLYHPGQPFGSIGAIFFWALKQSLKTMAKMVCLEQQFLAPRGHAGAP